MEIIEIIALTGLLATATIAVVTIFIQGNRLQKFPEIILRIRGIKKNESLSLYGKLQNVNFPHEVLKEINIINREKLNFYFVEPHVNQRFTFTTLIPEEYKFISIHSTFHYDEATPHTVEKIVEINAKQKNA